MRLLIDTHVLIWLVAGNQAISGAARRLLDGGAELVCVSVLSLWEIGLKRGIGKLPITVAEADAAVALAEYRTLPLLPHHVRGLASLPSHPDHRDPFDRMLLAQARHEGLTLMTEDAKLTRYGVPTIGCA